MRKVYAILWMGLILAVFLQACVVKKEEENKTYIVERADDNDDDQFVYALVAGSNWSGPNSLTVIQLRPEAVKALYFENLLQPNDAWRDPVVSVKDLSGKGRAYIVNRQFGSAVDQGSITVLDKELLFQAEQTFSVNAGTLSNPYDILVVNDSKAYVTRWDPGYNDILIVDPDTGAASGSIDFTGGGTNKDGAPKLAWLLNDDKRVYALLQNISADFTDYQAGRIAVIDPVTDAKAGIIDLTLLNPGSAGITGHSLYVACTGDWFTMATTGIEKVNTETLAAEGVTFTGAALGGFATKIAIVDENRAFVVVNDGNWPSTDKVVEVDLANQTVGDTWYTYAGLYVPDIALLGDELLVIADNKGSKVVVMSLESGNVEREITTNLPPVSVALWQGQNPL